MTTPSILYQDTDLLVLNKPSGMTVNNADTNKDEMTVQKWVEEKLRIDNAELTIEKTENAIVHEGEIKNQQYNIAEEFSSRGGIVHRLDKETSGVLVVAKNAESFGKLKEQFMTRTTEKVYLALAHGKIMPEQGEINAPVGRLPFNRMHFGVLAGGREAVTEYRVIASFKSQLSKAGEILSLVELHPKTGRTHQIRVHLKYINHPIVADPLYAGRKVGREDRKVLSRLFLHASQLTFSHPLTGERMTVKAPLPEELEEFINTLERWNMKVEDR